MKALIVVLVLTVLTLVVFGPYVDVRNGLVQKNEPLTAERSQVDVALERRGVRFPSPAAPIRKQARGEAFTRLQRK